jgi:hypothetical protein
VKQHPRGQQELHFSSSSLVEAIFDPIPVLMRANLPDVFL